MNHVDLKPHHTNFDKYSKELVFHHQVTADCLRAVFCAFASERDQENPRHFTITPGCFTITVASLYSSILILTTWLMVLFYVQLCFRSIHAKIPEGLCWLLISNS